MQDGFEPRFLRALGTVEAATDIAGLKRALEELLEPYGIKHAVIFAAAQAHAPDPRDTVVFTYPAEWVEHYMRHRYGDIDPVMRVGAGSIVPLDWATLDRSPTRVRRLFAEAADAGVGRQGLTLPSRSASGALALFSVTADVSDADWYGLRHDLMRDMSVIGSHLHARLLRLQRGFPSPGQAPARLSAREREALQWAAAGKTIDQTANLLGLSSSAVRDYLDAARRKLNCITKPQAVAVAMRLGLIGG